MSNLSSPPRGIAFFALLGPSLVWCTEYIGSGEVILAKRTGAILGQMAGWPRLSADAFRLCIPGISSRFSWKSQFHFFLLFFLLTNMIIVFTFGIKPVFLVKLGAILDGLLLTPFQALWVGVGLYYVMPKMFPAQVAEIIKPHWIFGVGLALAFIVFAYFCIFQIPYVF